MPWRAKWVVLVLVEGEAMTAAGTKYWLFSYSTHVSRYVYVISNNLNKVYITAIMLQLFWGMCTGLTLQNDLSGALVTLTGLPP